ncbi:MarR family transcriptional regulator [Pseudoxanthobacter sp.]|uniref:MarR family winged helix-turn-helix transcriptional regulator n=1 Tax=Pseudoxanthobacter sp. TaxID=1925742 RepID=UPI002FE3AE6D
MSSDPHSAPATDQPASRDEVDYGVLNRRFGYLLRRAEQTATREANVALAPFDLVTTTYSVLAIIESNPGISQIAVANALAVERARLVRLIDPLEERGLLQRRAGADRRANALHLTAKGRSILAGAHAVLDTEDDKVLARLDVADVAALVARFSVFRGG